VYEAIISTQNFQSIKNWRRRIWKGNFQLKIKLFLWLAVADKVLTWQILQQRGWSGPGRCHLCNSASEENAHLFIQCNFTKQVWFKICTLKKISAKWEGPDLDVCLSNCLEKKSMSVSLVALFVWHIWLERNMVLFEGKAPLIYAVVTKIMGASPNFEVSLGTKIKEESVQICHLCIRWLF
jgi:hypothetical protein